MASPTICLKPVIMSLEASDGIASFAQAYALGKQECGAAVNLLQRIPSEIKDVLTLLVQCLVAVFFE